LIRVHSQDKKGNMAKKERSHVSSVIEEISDEGKVAKDVLIATLRQSIINTFEEKIAEDDIVLEYNENSELSGISIKKTVVKENAANGEINLKKARALDPHCKIGNKIAVPLSESGFSRSEILVIKHGIGQGIKEIEAKNTYEKFKDKKGTIISGSIHKASENGCYVMLHGQLAFLPKEFMIPNEIFSSGSTIKAILKEVFQTPAVDCQLILERTSPDFIKKLIELEIPEVFDRTLTVEKCVRAAGYKSKLLISSKDTGISPVGTCVGVGGSRIKPVLKEIGGNERIDIIPFSNSLEKMIQQSFKPAELLDVKQIDEKRVQITVPENQRSIVIGLGGKNIALTSRLFDITLEIVER